MRKRLCLTMSFVLLLSILLPCFCGVITVEAAAAGFEDSEPLVSDQESPLPAPDGTRAESYLTDLGLEGYVGENLDGNIKNWQTVALDNNPNIIAQIKAAKSGLVPLSTIISDAGAVVSKGIYSIIAAPSGGYTGNSLCWKLLSTAPGHHRRDLHPSACRRQDIRRGSRRSRLQVRPGGAEIPGAMSASTGRRRHRSFAGCRRGGAGFRPPDSGGHPLRHPDL